MLLAGLVGAVVFGSLAAMSGSVVMLALGLVAGRRSRRPAPTSASGRVVVGWFPLRRRGLAMGIRQTAQPVGVGVAAATMAVVADRSRAVRRAVDPGRRLRAGRPRWWRWSCSTLPGRRAARPRSPNPYRGDRFLPRIHGVSVLLVVPQFVVWTFALVWLVQDRGWSPAAAGALVAVAQVAGALGRIAAGQLSDVVGSRMRPLRWVTLAAAATMLALGATAGLGLGGRRPAGRGGHGGDGRRQRPGVHRGGRAGRTVLVRPRPGHAEHRAVPRRVRGPAAGRADGDRTRLRARCSRWRRCSRWPPWRSCRSGTSAS